MPTSYQNLFKFINKYNSKEQTVKQYRNVKLNIQCPKVLFWNSWATQWRYWPTCSKYCQQLHSEITLDRYSIGVSHRLGPPQGSRHRDIIVRFIRYRDRDAVFRNKKSFASFNTIPTNNYKIFVNEAFTRRSALLFKKAQSTVKTDQASSC